jgi:hypothetical protein
LLPFIQFRIKEYYFVALASFLAAGVALASFFFSGAVFDSFLAGAALASVGAIAPPTFLTGADEFAFWLCAIDDPANRIAAAKSGNMIFFISVDFNCFRMRIYPNFISETSVA